MVTSHADQDRLVQILVVAAQEVLGTLSAGQEVGRPELIGLKQAWL